MYRQLHLCENGPQPSMLQIPVKWSFVVIGDAPINLFDDTTVPDFGNVAIIPIPEDCIVGCQTIV